jgi:hypothetical protein
VNEKSDPIEREKKERLEMLGMFESATRTEDEIVREGNIIIF